MRKKKFLKIGHKIYLSSIILKTLECDIKHVSVTVRPAMWEMITFNTLYAWSKVLNRSGQLQWYNMTVCPWVTPSLGKLLPWRQPGCGLNGSCWPYGQVSVRSMLERVSGQRGAEMCVCVCVCVRACVCSVCLKAGGWAGSAWLTGRWQDVGEATGWSGWRISAPAGYENS